VLVTSEKSALITTSTDLVVETVTLKLSKLTEAVLRAFVDFATPST